jgi:hypothetical protein
MDAWILGLVFSILVWIPLPNGHSCTASHILFIEFNNLPKWNVFKPISCNPHAHANWICMPVSCHCHVTKEFQLRGNVVQVSANDIVQVKN